jgi:Skp family chaperone for outer membrane proteins
MKNGNIARTLLAAAAALFVVSATSYAVAAQESPAAKIIIVDLREVQKSSKAGQDFARQVETLRQDLENDKQKLEKQAADAEEELSRQKPILSDAAFEEKRKAAAQQFGDSRNNLQDKANRVQIALSNADRDLQSALNPVYQSLLTKYGANMILDRSVLVMTGQVTDVTREVIQQLDQKMPSIKISLPAPGSTPRQ